MIGLSHIQKRDIAMAARKAYLAWPGREAFEAINTDLTRSACFEAWRHVETGKAVGIQSLCECTQHHYGRVLAHFQELAGDAAAAAHTHGRDADNGRRIAHYKLEQALRERGLPLEYASKICRQQYRVALAEASTGVLWRINFTIRSRHQVAKPVAVSADENPF